MKKFTLAAGLAILGVVGAQAQSSPRTMLLEHFTQASCGPCATYNPSIQSLITSGTNPDKLVSIKYQTSWPGTDPMNAHNPTDVQQRVEWYEVSGVPNSVVEGSVYNGHPTGWGQTTINTRSQVMSNFTMELTHSLNISLDTVVVHCKVKASDSVDTDNLRVQIAVLEEHIHFNSAPGSNGETDFFNVMKKMFPNGNGNFINGGTFAPGDSIEFEYTWAMENVYDVAEIAAIAWVEDTTTQEVQQAIFSQSSDAILEATNEVEIQSVNDVPVSICEAPYTGKVVIRNNGSATLTSLDISYSVNGGTATTTNWTGSLASLETTEIDVDFDYTAGTSDNIEVTISNPNNSVDEVNTNDSYSFNIDGPKSYQNYVLISVQADNEGLANSFKLVRKSDGEVIYERERFSISPNEKVEKLLALEHNECYEFTIEDVDGNGFKSGAYYRLRAGNGNYIHTGGTFGYSELVSWTADETLPLTIDTTGMTGIKELKQISMDVTPNPTNGNVRIYFPTEKVQLVQISNAIGEIIQTENMNGRIELNTDLSALENGVYFIRAIGKNGVVTRKLIKE